MNRTTGPLASWSPDAPGLTIALTDTAADPHPQDSRIDPAATTRPTATPKRTLVMRVVAVFVLLFTAWHLFASFLWIAPQSPLREVVPGKALTSYMIPFFGQSWSVFAPAPINGDYRLQIRATFEKNGEETTSEWVDATRVELDGLHLKHVFPPRAGTSALQQASTLKSAWEGLSAEQQNTVSLGYFKGDDWEERLSASLQATGPVAAAMTYLDAEKRTTAYATQVAHAIWGDRVISVQFQASRQNVIPFEDRNNPEATRPDAVIMPTGWRGLVTMPGQSEERFAEIFKPLYETEQDRK